MRNIFDQYTQPENRVTHALMSALHEDRALLDRFLEEICLVNRPGKKSGIALWEQSYPGEVEAAEDESERRGVPDAWIVDNEELCIVVESKVLSSVNIGQLERHLSIARRLGYQNPKMLVATVRQPERPLPASMILIEWRDIYGWLVSAALKSNWAKRAAHYLEVIEGQMADRGQLISGTLTTFSGFSFGEDSPYTILRVNVC